MPDKIEKINGHLETLALRVVTLEEGDIPGMGQILNTICSLETDSEGMDESVFLLRPGLTFQGSPLQPELLTEKPTHPSPHNQFPKSK